jgi:formylglycine-generating enzyme required for sulfatase activity
MVLVTGDSFTMGATGGNFDLDETPSHVVTLGSFYIDAYEVSVARFARFADASGYQTDAERGGDGTTWRTFNSTDRQKFPVTYVSWNDAVRFCAYYGGRLPTEAEWEYAARGNTKRMYPWGDTFNAAWANTVELGAGQPVVIASNSAPSPYGAYDMSGNVWEWVQDWYASDYYRTSPASNPIGPATGLKKVIRGGSFKTKGNAATTTARGQASIDGRGDDIGFWCVRSQ